MKQTLNDCFDFFSNLTICIIHYKRIKMQRIFTATIVIELKGDYAKL